MLKGRSVILEGIVTTVCDTGRVNISPMGPLVDDELTQLVLRPFRTSTTYVNLKRTGAGVFHVTDDVELLARAAVDLLEQQPALVPAQAVEGWILADACRWYAFRVLQLDDRQERTTIHCQVVDRGRIRDFLGFNRAMYAVVEAAILATRVYLVPGAQILAEYQRLKVIVEKTAGPRERRAFEFLTGYVQACLGHAAAGESLL
ncbi:MAG: DUF447 family protein [Pirellulaceae bacterium]|nr:DUF447 family protein [Pirellulaceae bacterium]